MRMKLRGWRGALLLAVIGISAHSPPAAISQACNGDAVQHSVLQIPTRGNFPSRQTGLDRR